MEQLVKEILSPSKLYKVQIKKRKDGLFTTVVSKWFEEPWCDYWSPISSWLSLIDTEEHAITIAIEQLREYSGEMITWDSK